jgi:uncharacterized protein (TIGR03118 family)
MRKTRSYLAWMTVGASAIALAACGGGHSNNNAPAPVSVPTPTPTPAPAPAGYATTTLDSNVAGAGLMTDSNLSHGWGIAFGANSEVWVADHNSNLSTLYDGLGDVDSAVVVSIPAAASGSAAGPTGIVANATSGFQVTQGGATAPAAFIFAGTGGTISAWAQGATAVTTFDGSANHDTFTGLAIYTQGSTNMILAADFGNGVVDAFDSTFKPLTLAGGFKDPSLPAGYAPFGIQTIGTMIYVSYAEQPATPGPEVDGAGLGLIDVFDGTGTFVKRLVSTGGALNAPWGMAVAPGNFGTFSSELLVGNFGDGKINVYDPSTGASKGVVSDANNNPIVIPGLWGIAFGNGAFSQPTNTLFYAAGPTATQGIYGRLDMAGAFSPPGAAGSGVSSAPASSTPTPTPTPTPPNGGLTY